MLNKLSGFLFFFKDNSGRRLRGGPNIFELPKTRITLGFYDCITQERTKEKSSYYCVHANSAKYEKRLVKTLYITRFLKGIATTANPVHVVFLLIKFTLRRAVELI